MAPVAPTAAALEFASPTMLGWLAAAALPLAVNLWSRRRHDETPWAAVDLLMAAVQQRRRRLRLREWLLLAMRCGVLLLAALAVAGPRWRDRPSADRAAARTHHVIVVDQSFSMMRQTGRSTAFDEALRRAAHLVEIAPAGDLFTVVAWAGEAENLLGRATSDAAAARAAISQLQPTDARASIATALHAAQAAIDGARQEFPAVNRSEVVFVTDLAANTWGAALPDARRTEAPDDVPAEWSKLAAAAHVVLDDVATGGGDNVAISDLRIAPAAPLAGQPTAVEAEISAFGSQTFSQLPVELFIDGASIGTRRVAAQPGEPSVLAFPVTLANPGSCVVEARIAAADGLAVDNRRWLVADVRRQTRVTCFADSVDDASDVARAMNPHFREPADGDRIAVTVAPASTLATTELAANDLVVFCNVSRLAPRQQRLMRHYVASGGALLIVAGDRTSPAAFDELVRGEADGGQLAAPLLPIRLQEPVAGDWRIDPLGYRHPAVAAFKDQPRSGLLDVLVSQYFPATIAADGGDVQLALAFTSGDPALAICDHGRGRVAVLLTSPSLATAAGAPWSTWAVNPSWVPLVRELLNHLTVERQGAERNRLVGQRLPELNRPGRWLTPAGDRSPASAPTRQRGVYVFTDPSPGNNVDDSEPAPLRVAVNVDPQESDLAQIDARPLLRTTPSAVVADGSGAYRAATSLVQPLLLAAAILLLFELATAWAFGRGAL